MDQDQEANQYVEGCPMFKTRRHTIIASQRNPMMLTPPCVLVHLSPHPDNNNNSTGTRPETLRPARSGASFAVECFDRRPSRDVRQVRWGWGQFVLFFSLSRALLLAPVTRPRKGLIQQPERSHKRGPFDDRETQALTVARKGTCWFRKIQQNPPRTDGGEH